MAAAISPDRLVDQSSHPPCTNVVKKAKPLRRMCLCRLAKDGLGRAQQARLVALDDDDFIVSLVLQPALKFARLQRNRLLRARAIRHALMMSRIVWNSAILTKFMAGLAENYWLGRTESINFCAGNQRYTASIKRWRFMTRWLKKYQLLQRRNSHS